MTRANRRDWIVMIFLGILMVSLACWLAEATDSHEGFPFFLGGYFALFIVYLLAVYYVCGPCGSHGGLVGFVLVVAVALRLPFLFSQPSFSDDIYRYIWDGRVQRAGINPYRFAPEAPQLRHLRDPIYEGINNKDVPTIYPPLMQVVFAATTAVSDSAVWMKGTFVLADFLLIGVLIGLLKTTGSSPMRALVYAWSPLVIIETAGSGHNDVLAIAFLLAAHIAIIHKKDAVSMCFLGLSGLAKLMGFILAPLFARRVRVAAWLVLPVVCSVAALPYLGVGSEAFLGLLAYGTRWRANDSLFHVLLLLTGSIDTAKAIAAGLFAGVEGLLLLRNTEPLRACYWAIGTLLLLAATVHPWYVMWIVPYLCFYTNPAWLLLTGTIMLSYHAPFLSPAGHAWVEHGLYKLLEYGPFYVLGAVGLLLPRFRSVRKAQSFVL